jgi:alkanesulfonate monooxygenase SsuD/methylene tetrahydromethanopterin reductase-like flavin-dependent oxidoreductase (luciferase family)
MLRLTGRKADGWLPSLPYLPVEQIGPANRTIDEAANEAARDPRDVRRMLNAVAPQGSTAEQVEQLLPFVLEHGFSTFVVPGDDAQAIERFGHELAPALREAVARERR